jgi:ABC-type bacteriocin/lantibiotic exporter with double-glycine peptidase domain
MKTFDSSASSSGHLSSQIEGLLDQLRATQKPHFSTYLLPIVLAIAFGGIMWSNGRPYGFVYVAALTVTVLLHDISERRTRRQIDLVLALLREQQKTKDSTNAA